MCNVTKLHVGSKHSIAPPTGQSFRYICAYNFWTVSPIFKTKVSLDSLDHSEFNAPYDVIICPDRFCAILDYVKSETNCSVAANLTDSHENRHRVYSDQYAQKSLDGFFNFHFVCELQPIEISGEGADFDVSPYLRNALAKQNQIVWHASRLCPKCRKQIWCHYVSRGRYN